MIEPRVKIFQNEDFSFIVENGFRDETRYYVQQYPYDEKKQEGETCYSILNSRKKRICIVAAGNSYHAINKFFEITGGNGTYFCEGFTFYVDASKTKYSISAFLKAGLRKVTRKKRNNFDEKKEVEYLVTNFSEKTMGEYGLKSLSCSGRLKNKKLRDELHDVYSARYDRTWNRWFVTCENYDEAEKCIAEYLK